MTRMPLITVFAGATTVVVAAIMLLLATAAWWATALAFVMLLAMLTLVGYVVHSYLDDAS